MIVVVAAVLPLWLSAYMLGVLTLAYYFGVFSMSWDLLFGFAGEVNFGPTFLIGLGAYTAAILDNQYHQPIPVCVLAGALAALIGGLLLAMPALRLRGPYFGLVTLVAVLLLQNAIVIFAARHRRRDRDDRARRALDRRAGELLVRARLLDRSARSLLFGLSRSAIGLILQASGQDAIEAAALGFNVTKHKLAAFRSARSSRAWRARCSCSTWARRRSAR